MRSVIAVAVSVVLLAAAKPAGQGQTVPKLRVQGTQFIDETGRAYVPRWVSGLTLLARSAEQQAAYLDWAARTGFNGVRVFAGALTWAEQSPESARAGLPSLLDRAAARGLVVEVTALTDTATGFDARAHLRAIVDVLAGRRGVVLEIANEVGHGSQAADLTPARLLVWGRDLVAPRGILWAVGAVAAPVLTGTFSTLHVDRGGDRWAQLAAVKAIQTAAVRLGVPVISNEPIGADDASGRETGRQRVNDPALFLAFGALDRASGFGGVHHSQAGLMAALPGPVQQRCADAYIAGHRAVQSIFGDGRGIFREVGQSAAPLRLVSGLPRERVLTFIDRDQAIVVIAGASKTTGLRWADGWKVVRVVTTMPGTDGRRVDVIHAAFK